VWVQPSLLPAAEGAAIEKDTRFVLDYPEAELVFGLVFAVGTDYKPALDYLKDQIKLSGYAADSLQLSDWFGESIERLGFQHALPTEPEYERIASRISAGNKIRATTGRQDILALIAASKIFSTREIGEDENPIAHKRRAHILVSLKRPEEVESLRKIYGPGFFLIGIFADESERIDFLTNRKGLEKEQAASLINIDQKQTAEEYGQRTRDTFQMADLFVGVADKEYEKGLQRFLRLIFGDPFITPSRDEHSMFLAYAASLRSGDLARQVGAALTCAQGDLISLGCNDVPSPGGGLYCADDGDDDARDHKLRKDSNDARKDEIIDDVILAFSKKFLPTRDPEEILKEARPLLRETLVSDVTEFGRAVHAEMDAIITAGRTGVSFSNSTLYTTTFPCHTCTRHIIAAGVKRVVYIEPYPKSLAKELHSDAIRISGEKQKNDRRVPFEPFLGIGPRRFFDLFSMKLSSGYVIERKHDGTVVDWDQRRNSKPRVPMAPTSYLEREQLIQITLNSVFSIKREENANDAKTTGIAGQERRGVLDTPREDSPPSRKVARMEDRRTGDNLAAGDDRK
jgi:deoxycytidylate deaminase